MTGATDRDTKGEEWGYYYVTRLGFCPAVLFEVGFIPNPEQYEACADWETICETASGLAERLPQARRRSRRNGRMPVCPPGGRAACGPMPGFCREWTRTERGMCRAQRTVGGWYRPEL